MAEVGQITTDAPLDEDQDGSKYHSGWMDEITRAEKKFRPWFDRSDKILARFRDEREQEVNPTSNATRRYNLLWSNIKLLQPTLYSQMPEPEVARRHKDKDVVARTASEVLRRALRYDMEADDFDSTMKSARDDYLLPGRGTAWVHYLPKFADEPITPTKLYFATEDEAADEAAKMGVADVFHDEEMDQFYVQPDPFKPVVDEACPTEHVLWNEFLHTVTEKWERVWWVARVHLLTREELKAWFGDEMARKITLDSAVPGVDVPKTGVGALSEHQQRARVYEVWDKKTRTVQWLSRGYEEGPIARVTDPLGLAGFFPCPRPLFATITTNNLIPISDYVMYQDQAAELDRMTHRIALLQQALRVVGVYNAANKEIQNLLGDTVTNQMIPVQGWAQFAEKGGIANQIEWFPIKDIVGALESLYKARETVKQEMYEITGLSDIIRGASDPRETLGAQQLKGTFASKRLVDRQRDVAEFARALISIKAEIICNKFDPEILRFQSGYDVMLGVPQDQQAKEHLWQQVVALLKDNMLRRFRIDVETDSTVQPNADADKQQRVEYIQAISQLLSTALPAVQQFPQLGEFVTEIALFGTRGWSNAAGLETVLEEALDKLKVTPPPTQQDNGQAQADQAKAQIEQAKLQQDGQNAEADRQIEMERIRSAERVQMAKIQAEYQAAQDAHQIKVMELGLQERNVAATEAKLGLQNMKQHMDAALTDKGLDVEVQRTALMAEQHAHSRAMDRAGLINGASSSPDMNGGPNV